MKISDPAALRYGRYRRRFLEGPRGPFTGTPVPDFAFNDPVSGVPVVVPTQKPRAKVQFLRQLTSDPSVPGTFVHTLVEKVLGGDPGDGLMRHELAGVESMKHGDNILHVSWAMLAFVCEYAITYDLRSLEISRNILRSFQRLGSHAQGYHEVGPAPWGYLLRADTADDEEVSERISTWLSDRDAADSLEPSFDQYTSLLCCSAFADSILRDPARRADPSWPSDAAHTAMQLEVRSLIRERVATCHNFLANYCKYYIRRSDGRPSKRGEWGWQFAYPIARVTSWVLDAANDRNNYLHYLAPFAHDILPQIFDLFERAAIDFAGHNAARIASFALLGVPGVILELVLEGMKSDALRRLEANVFGVAMNLWDFLSRFGFGCLEQDLDAIIVNKATEWIAAIVSPLIEAALAPLLNIGDAIDLAVSDRLAKWLFSVFSRICMLQPLPTFDSGFFATNELTAFDLAETLGLFNIADLPGNIVGAAFQVSVNLTTRAVNGTDILGHSYEIVGPKSWGSFEMNLQAAPLINWADVLKKIVVPIRINAKPIFSEFARGLNWTSAQLSNALGQAALALGRGAFLPFGYFAFNAAADTFGEVNANEELVSKVFQNSLFGSISHGLRGASETVGDDVLSILDTAPDNFPNGHDKNYWNKDFRWLRDIDRKDQGDELYSGLDYMAALMIACVGDAALNRDAIRAGIAEAYDVSDLLGEDEPGTIKLPFVGPVSTPQALFLPTELFGSNTAVIAVVFSEPGVRGQIKIRVRVPEVGDEILTFEQESPSQAFCISMDGSGPVIEEITAGTVGVIMISGLD